MRACGARRISLCVSQRFSASSAVKLHSSYPPDPQPSPRSPIQVVLPPGLAPEERRDGGEPLASLLVERAVAAGRAEAPLKGGDDFRRLVVRDRSEEHTSELQSRRDLVCRLLLEKKKNTQKPEARASHMKL